MIDRDVQRSRVYAAETVVRRMLDRAATGTGTVDLHGSTLTLPPERRFASVASINRYVDQVVRLSWVRAAWPARAAVPVTVVERGGQAKAEYHRLTASIAIPPYQDNAAWAMRELVVLHELAHHLGADDEEPHGPAFCDRMLTLVEGVIGPEVARLLRSTLHDAGARLSLVATG